MDKKSKTKLSSKETLIAYVSTLSEGKCKIAYQALQERFEIHRKRNLLFNREGIEALAPDGKVRLTPNQYQKVLEIYGELGFHRLVEILYDYIVNLEERAPVEVTAKQRLKTYQSISHYYKMTQGWVAQRYEQEHPEFLESKPKMVQIEFKDIDNKSKAIEYINSIPKHLRYENMEIDFLIAQYNISKEELDND